VFDLTDLASFYNIKAWLHEIHQHNSNADIPILLVGNKLDLTHKRLVSDSEISSFAESAGLPFILTSARTNNNVSLMFDRLAHNYLDMYSKKLRELEGEELQKWQTLQQKKGKFGAGIDIVQRESSKHGLFSCCMIQ
jgi:GTPase SAR1 family protein